jgi:hypothetical protein
MESVRRGAIYIGLGVIFAASYLLASSLPAGDVLRGIAGNVGLAALIGALFRMFRDEAAHERAILMRRDEQQFQVGVTSHMSNVVFDKHVVFCEEYMAEVRATVTTLFRNHADAEAIVHANRLYDIRRQHGTWVTSAMSLRLSGFEDAIRKMGAQAHFIEVTSDSPQYAEQRGKAIESVYRAFERILPQYFNGVPEEGIASESVEERVREILEIERLVELRTRLIERAHASLPPDTGSSPAQSAG